LDLVAQRLSKTERLGYALCEPAFFRGWRRCVMVMRDADEKERGAVERVGVGVGGERVWRG
jgi:hypothetical protein